jgi:hypothetical protein
MNASKELFNTFEFHHQINEEFDPNVILFHCHHQIVHRELLPLIEFASHHQINEC